MLSIPKGYINATSYLSSLGANRKLAADFIARLLKDFPPGNYGCKALFAHPKISAKFALMDRQEGQLGLGIGVNYPPGRDRTNFFEAFDCASATLAGRSIIKDLFSGKHSPITKLITTIKDYDFSSEKIIEDAIITHFAIDVTNLLPSEPALAKNLEEMDSLLKFKGKAYLDLTPLKIEKVIDAWTMPEPDLTIYPFAFNSESIYSWPQSGDGYSFSFEVFPPQGLKFLPPATFLLDKPLKIRIYGSKIREHVYTGEKFYFNFPILFSQWGNILPYVKQGARLSIDAKGPEILRNVRSSPALENDFILNSIQQECFPIILNITKVIMLALDNLPKDVRLFDWIPYAMEQKKDNS